MKRGRNMGADPDSNERKKLSLGTTTSRHPHHEDVSSSPRGINDLSIYLSIISRFMQWLTTHPMQQLTQTLKMVPQLSQKKTCKFLEIAGISFFWNICAISFGINESIGPEHFSVILFFCIGWPNKKFTQKNCQN